MPVMGAGQWTGLFFLLCAVTMVGGWQVAKILIEDGTPAGSTMRRLRSLAKARDKTRPQIDSAQVSQPGQRDTRADAGPDALDLLIAAALPAELVAAAEEAIGEALMILARTADLLAAA